MGMIKGDFTSIPRRPSSLAHQWCLRPPQSHMATVTPSICGQFVVFWVARESPTTVDPWLCSLRCTTKPDPVSEVPVPNLAPFRRQLYDLPLWFDVLNLHPLGSASWCTRYGSARKRTYSNQLIFLFPEQNGRMFAWRPSGVGVPHCSARSVWAPGRSKSTMEIRSITEIYNFRRAPVVGVPIAEVANTLVSWLRWMVSSYVCHLDTKMTSLRSACLNT
jgi:hypothetical protein